MFLESFISLLLPSYCFACRKIGPELCSVCAQKLHACVRCEVVRSGVILSCFTYRDVAKITIRAGKFFSVRGAIDRICHCIPKEYHLKIYERTRVGRWVVVPIPLHASRYTERGFNQSDIIAKHIAARVDLPMVHVLKRVKKTQQQATLHRSERLRNVRGAFQIIDADVCVDGVVLVDDVWTTGSTMREAVRVLNQHGIQNVLLCVLARPV